MRIGVWNYGFGNIASVQRSLIHLGKEVFECSSAESLSLIDLLVLPGVGSFGAALQSLRNKGSDLAIKEFSLSGKPIIGICLGAQILFEKSDESEGEQGLSLIRGRVARIEAHRLFTYQGWHSTRLIENNQTSDKRYFFYSHGYKILPSEGTTTAVVEHVDEEIIAGHFHNNMYGIQFHPEKSSDSGLLFLSKVLRLLD